LCFFCFTFFAGFLSGNFSQLFSSANGNFTFLLQFGIFFFTNNLQARLFSFQIFSFDRQIGILFDVVTLATAVFNGFSELGQTFGIEGILWIKVFGGVSKSMLKKSRLNFDKIEKCK